MPRARRPEASLSSQRPSAPASQCARRLLCEPSLALEAARVQTCLCTQDPRIQVTSYAHQLLLLGELESCRTAAMFEQASAPRDYAFSPTAPTWRSRAPRRVHVDHSHFEVAARETPRNCRGQSRVRTPAIGRAVTSSPMWHGAPVEPIVSYVLLNLIRESAVYQNGSSIASARRRQARSRTDHLGQRPLWPSTRYAGHPPYRRRDVKVQRRPEGLLLPSAT